MKNAIKRIFQGRLARKHYFLAHIYILFPIAFIGGVMGSLLGLNSFEMGIFIGSVLFPIIIIPVTVRRLHDLGLSGWVLPIFFLVPYLGNNFSLQILVGLLFSGYLFFYQGKQDANKYGKPAQKDRKFWDAVLNRNIANVN